jgi:GT2 family glycosyltransferase
VSVADIRAQAASAADDQVSVSSVPSLAIVPTYLRKAEDLDVLLRCLVSLSVTAPELDVLVVDDASPASQLIDQVAAVLPELGADLMRKSQNSGFSATVNVGLRRALEWGQDALLVNADLEFETPGWWEAMRDRTDTQGRPAAVVGALLTYPTGLIQHGGVFFSLHERRFHHRFRFAAADLAEAQVPTRCPVTGALQLIRHRTLTEVGLYDEGFKMGLEDIDYCLRTFSAGLECIYEPRARAIHAESVFRGRANKKILAWQETSVRHLWAKYPFADFSPWVPAL